MKSLIIFTLFILSVSTFAKSWDRTDSSRFDELLHLFICTEEAPILCKHFGLDKRTAKVKIARLCGMRGASLRAIWRNNRIQSFVCYVNFSDNQCRAQGYDCSLDGQCVIDAALRPEASTHPDYEHALLDVEKDPVNYVYWPHIFYVCPVR